jgi:hypothetical protein
MTNNGSGILIAGGQPELVVVFGSGKVIAGEQPELVLFLITLLDELLVL